MKWRKSKTLSCTSMLPFLLTLPSTFQLSPGQWWLSRLILKPWILSTPLSASAWRRGRWMISILRGQSRFVISNHITLLLHDVCFAGWLDWVGVEHSFSIILWYESNLQLLIIQGGVLNPKPSWKLRLSSTMASEFLSQQSTSWMNISTCSILDLLASKWEVVPLKTWYHNLYVLCIVAQVHQDRSEWNEDPELSSSPCWGWVFNDVLYGTVITYCIRKFHQTWTFGKNHPASCFR